MPTNPIGGKPQLTPAQRMMLFEQATRQHVLRNSTMIFAENSTITQTIPKSRLLSKIYLLVQGTFKLTHASKTTYASAIFNKYNLLRNIKLGINNGFNPYQISGNMLYLYNMQNEFKDITDTSNTLDYITNVVSAAGATNTVSFMVELPLTLNNRDLMGIVNLQSGTTVVDLTIDCNPVTKIMTDTDITASNVNITVTPILETFSIPPFPEAIPPYNTFKIVNEQRESGMSGSEYTIKLPVGLTYRKVMLYLASDSAYTPIPASSIDSFQISFNQADAPYDIPAAFVQAKNAIDYGQSLPTGTYVIDFSCSGIPNYGNSRDYIESKKLSELWLKVRFNNLGGSSNAIYVVGEKLATVEG